MGATDEPLEVGARTRIQRLAERQPTDGGLLHRILDTAILDRGIVIPIFRAPS